MSTHDYIIDNAVGATVRADINSALAAIVSNNSNTTEPATLYAYQWWADTTSGLMKQRNAANSAWVTKFVLSEGQLALLAGSSSQAFSTASLTVAGLLDISGASAGQIKFPATQNASSDANTLDDYEVGTWTPAISAATVGNLSISYSGQSGRYQKVGNTAHISYSISTSSFTHTTASGGARITGLPFTAATSATVGGIDYQGITAANYTTFMAITSASTTYMNIFISGSAQTRAQLTISGFPTGGTVILTGCGHFDI